MPARAPIVTSRPHGSVLAFTLAPAMGRPASSITLTESPSFIGGRRARRTSPRSFATPATSPGVGTVRDTCSGAPTRRSRLARGQACDLERPVLARAHGGGGRRRQDGGHAREPHRALGVHHAALERRHAEAEVHAAHRVAFVRRRVLLRGRRPGGRPRRGRWPRGRRSARPPRRRRRRPRRRRRRTSPAARRGTRRPGGPRGGSQGSACASSSAPVVSGSAVSSCGRGTTARGGCPWRCRLQAGGPRGPVTRAPASAAAARAPGDGRPRAARCGARGRVGRRRASRAC